MESSQEQKHITVNIIINLIEEDYKNYKKTLKGVIRRIHNRYRCQTCTIVYIGPRWSNEKNNDTNKERHKMGQILKLINLKTQEQK